MATDKSPAVPSGGANSGNDGPPSPPVLGLLILAGYKTMKILAFPTDRVQILHLIIQKFMGIPISDQILRYGRRPLLSHHTLSQCLIPKDAMIVVSSRYPARELLNDMISVISKMLNGCEVPNASEKIQTFLRRYVFMYDNFQTFLDLSVAEKMVMLYMSIDKDNKSCGEECIRLLVRLLYMSDNSKYINGFLVVMELSTLLTRVGCDNPLYMYCRTVASSIMKVCVNSKFLLETEGMIMRGALRFVGALTNSLLTDLSLPMHVVGKRLSFAFSDFKVFFVKYSSFMRTNENYGENDFDYHVIASLRGMLLDLFKKMDECLENMEKHLASEYGREVNLGLYFNILKELYHMSKLHGDAEQEFLSLLKNQRNMFCLLILHYANRSDDHDWILDHRSVTDFRSRRHLVMMMFHKVNSDSRYWYEMLIDRTHLVAESFEYLIDVEPEELKSGILIQFKNEVATGPGVIREWFLLVCQQLFNPQNALFMTCPYDQRRIFPNSASKVHDDHHKYFKFSGRMIALALKHNIQVGIVLDRVFFTLLAGKKITLQDIQETDPQYYSSCKKILEMDDDLIDSDALGLTFIREEKEFGVTKLIELCQGGKNLVVNSKNRDKFVDLVIKDRFATSISDQVAHFAQGFTDILIRKDHQKFFQSLELEDLDWMLYGVENAISIEDWKAHTKYKGYTQTDPQIVWFWEIVERMSAEERRTLLFFWTAVKYLPIEGFRGLSKSISIYKSSSFDRLPSSHTCFNELCLPAYPSMDVMEARLRTITQEHISFSFGDL